MWYWMEGRDILAFSPGLCDLKNEDISEDVPYR